MSRIVTLRMFPHNISSVLVEAGKTARLFFASSICTCESRPDRDHAIVPSFPSTQQQHSATALQQQQQRSTPFSITHRTSNSFVCFNILRIYPLSVLTSFEPTNDRDRKPDLDRFHRTPTQYPSVQYSQYKYYQYNYDPLSFLGFISGDASGLCRPTIMRMTVSANQ
jgi:hypothetical protein